MKPIALATLAILLVVGCTKQATDPKIKDLEREVASLKKTVEDLKPGLGEIMTTVHLHHAKLFFSGKNENWDLAAYQLDEIKEGLDQATELHDHFKELKASLKELRHMTDAGIGDLEAAIHNRNKSKFMAGFQKLTVSCNQCHQAAEHGFIVIQEPTTAMFSNQSFVKGSPK
jgi:hypothetical protein